MPIPQKLCIVADMFFITGRGPVIVTGDWQTGQLRPGDWIELRSATGEHRQAQVKSIEMVRWATRDRWVDANNPFPLLLAGISREAIHVGDEIWSVNTEN